MILWTGPVRVWGLLFAKPSLRLGVQLSKVGVTLLDEVLMVAVPLVVTRRKTRVRTTVEMVLLLRWRSIPRRDVSERRVMNGCRRQIARILRRGRMLGLRM